MSKPQRSKGLSKQERSKLAALYAPKPAYKSSMRAELTWLLGELCSGWGYCSISSADDEKFRSKKRWEADAFAREILRAEGLNPETCRDLFKSLRSFFTDRYGPVMEESLFDTDEREQ